MPSYIKSLLVATIISGTVVAALHNRSRTVTSQQQEQIDTSRFPTVDYTSPPPTDLNDRSKRERISKKYNSRYAPQITESTDKVFHSLDWDSGLPALPVTKSSAVILGEVIDAQAHLSEDKTTVYSEFVVRIESILKNDDKISMSPGGLTTLERLGGKVRFPSGKVVTFWVSHQDLPAVGGRYVLFLTHGSPLGGTCDDSLFIVTGYELRAGKVFPLDKVSPYHPIAKYKGVDETFLLTELRAALSVQ